ncbi:MAG: GTPase Era [Cystobacterineae bacterium]|nr:GTPase Era [Cystobacterineae bacterium]
MRSGFAALIGQPNVGKSTLLNRLIGEKISIVSRRAQTTRNRILGVLTRDEAQVAFWDTPGIHQPSDALTRYMLKTAFRCLEECDVVVWIVDATNPSLAKTKQALARMRVISKPALLLMNKIDLIEKPSLLPLIQECSKLHAFAGIIPVSALTGDGIEDFWGTLVPLCPEGEAMFSADTFADQSELQLAEEFIREQALRLCRQEIPYSTAVRVEHFDESNRFVSNAQGEGLQGLVRIEASIYVEREGQKAIVIGKQGQMLKKIGTAARLAMERMLNARVYLGLRVKVDPRWSDSAEGLKRMGYASGD